VLERAGLIVRGQRAQYRPCALDAAPLAAVADWAEQYRPIWEDRFDRMDDYLAHLQPKDTNSADPNAAATDNTSTEKDTP